MVWLCGEGSGSGALTTEQSRAMKDTALKGKGLGSDLPLDTCDLCAAPLEPFTPCPESPGSALGWLLAGKALGLPPLPQPLSLPSSFCVVFFSCRTLNGLHGFTESLQLKYALQGTVLRHCLPSSIKTYLWPLSPGVRPLPPPPPPFIVSL